MLLDEIARHTTKLVTHSSAAAFVAKGTTRVLVREPLRKARRDAMKQRQQKPGRSQQLGHY